MAGVSPATVSRVITNKRNISDKARMKVQQAISQINYVPNVSAQSPSPRNRTICFTIAREPWEVFGNPFFGNVLSGLSNEVEKQDLNLQFAMFHNVEQQIEKCLMLYQQKKVDGFILTGVLSTDKDRLLNNFQEYGIPFVMIGRSLGHSVFSVQNDNMRDGYMAAKYLIDEGYRDILLLTQDVKQDVFVDRIAGYTRAVQEHDLDFGQEHIIHTGTEESDITESLTNLLDGGLTFDAIMTTDPVMSLVALKFCQSRGLRVPEDVGIIGFNDAPYLDKVLPTISCVEMMGFNLGTEALRLLIEMLDEPQTMIMKKNVTLPSEIIIRQSTKRFST